MKCLRLMLKLRFAAAATLIFAAAAFTQTPNTNDWLPVTPAELAIKEPAVEKGADAEALFWRVEVDNKDTSAVIFRHYVRVKIFTERGREKFAKLDVPFVKGLKIENLSARVILPDGTIRQSGAAETFTRDIVKANKLKVQALSMAITGVEVGAIVEYRYNERIKNALLGETELVFQRDIPIRNITYSIRPLKGMNFWTTQFNLNPSITPIKRDDGFTTLSLDNVPALTDEPYMPPENEVRKWIMFSYGIFGDPFLDTARAWSLLVKSMEKPSKTIREKSAELTAGKTTKRDKVEAIYKFVQTQIKNTGYDDEASADILKDRDIDKVEDVLKNRIGSRFQVDLLFAKLVAAAGIDVKAVLTGDKSEVFFTRDRYPFRDYISFAGWLVDTEQGPKLVDACSKTVPFGTLPWYREGVQALFVGNGNMMWGGTSMNGADDNRKLRSGKFTLSADGTLEGDVRLEFLGQEAIVKKENLYRKSPPEREKVVSDEIKEMINGAEVSAISITGLDDSSAPLIYQMRVRVPSYARKTGKRLFIVPNVFEASSKPVFSASERRYPLVFPYPWSEEDTISIRLGDGIIIDSVDSPADIRNAARTLSESISITHDKQQNTLNYTRNFYFGKDRKLLFPVDQYPAFKQFFDMLHKAETHAIAANLK